MFLIALHIYLQNTSSALLIRGTTGNPVGHREKERGGRGERGERRVREKGEKKEEIKREEREERERREQFAIIS